MAIYLPIISQFSDKGIKRAKREFQSLEGAAAKTKFALKQAFAPAAAALGGLAAAGFSAVTAAMEDAKAQAELARQLGAVTKATDLQIASVEDWISTQGKLLGVTDDELRPAYGKLIRVTKDFGKTQDTLSLAMDVSAATGKDLNTVTDLFAKALGGNVKALARSFPQYKKLIDSGATAEEVFAAMSEQVGGAATEAAETTAGKFQRLKVRMDELKESIGEKLTPIIERFIPYLEKAAEWAEKNEDKILLAAGAIGVFAGAIVAANIAITLSNPFGAIAAGITLLVTGLVIAYNKFDWFRNGVDTMLKKVRRYFEIVVNAWIDVINVILRGYNAIPFVDDVKLISRVDFTPDGRPGSSAGNARRFEEANRYTPAFSMTEGLGPYAPSDPRSRTMPRSGTIVVNNYSADPQAVVRALQNETRRTGSIGGVRVR
jgi:hypothetical protein